MISLPQKPCIISQRGNIAVIEIESLYPGYGLTIGNALRRVLLSSLPGAAATSMKIAGIKHEFSTIPGVVEDVVEIALNLKQIRFRLHGGERQRITLSRNGIAQVKAGDFELPSQVEIANPEQHVATLTDRATSFELDALVESGIGYQPVEERKLGKLPIGEIALDATFTPVRRVALEVEDMRVGERTDYNKLRLTIETDGTSTPQAAFVEAADILVEQFQTIKEISVSQAPAQVETEQKALVAERADRGDEALLRKRVEELGVSTRVSNALLRAGIKTIGGLAHRIEASLLELEGLGEGSVKEIRKELGKLGLTLKK